MSLACTSHPATLASRELPLPTPPFHSLGEGGVLRVACLHFPSCYPCHDFGSSHSSSPLLLFITRIFPPSGRSSPDPPQGDEGHRIDISALPPPPADVVMMGTATLGGPSNVPVVALPPPPPPAAKPEVEPPVPSLSRKEEEKMLSVRARVVDEILSTEGVSHW